MSIKAEITGKFTSSEITESRVQWIKHVQYEAIEKLQNYVITLGLKIKEDGMLRCHGRFNNADITEETKVLIYLPRKSYWAELIVKEFHQKLFHAGLSHTLSQIRNRYWMPQGRTIVRNVIQHCEIC